MRPRVELVGVDHVSTLCGGPTHWCASQTKLTVEEEDCLYDAIRG